MGVISRPVLKPEEKKKTVQIIALKYGGFEKIKALPLQELRVFQAEVRMTLGSKSSERS